MADTAADAKRKQVLEALATEEAMGVTFDDDRDVVSQFPDGSPAIHCTSNAQRMIALAGNGEIYGWADTNPAPRKIATQGGYMGGHDFAFIDGRYLVDAWAKLVECSVKHAVFDLNNPADVKKVRKLYGDPAAWMRKRADDSGYDPGCPPQLQPHR